MSNMYSYKRDKLDWQKRPTMEAKKTYYEHHVFIWLVFIWPVLIWRV